MRFFGSQPELEALIDSAQNQYEAVLMDAFNAGYKYCQTMMSEMYTQADAAVEQKIINDIPAGQNPFITLLQKANKMKDTSLSN